MTVVERAGWVGRWKIINNSTINNDFQQLSRSDTRNYLLLCVLCCLSESRLRQDLLRLLDQVAETYQDTQSGSVLFFSFETTIDLLNTKSRINSG
ncbi:hypothetical protein NPIL_540991 [Nephila pilipes]|uniref:Uncharacterized protein n=1 Tax=Nephila pilipes TaxID=299642 RepID=A0A8X6TYB3_NEPPI|nr:hypothetical protein NPIL_540991 [Nephila pilipes]